MTNARFEDLEKRAKRLQLKQTLKIVSVIIFTCTLFIGVFFIYNSQQKTPSIVAQQLPKEEALEIKKEPLATPEKKEEIFKIEQEILKEQNNTSMSYDTIKLTLSIPHDIVNPRAEVLESSDSVLVKEVLQKKEKEPSFTMEVKATNKEEVLLRDFSTNKNFESALALCEVFFEQSSYQKAIFWAKEASRIKPDSPKPWIIYAQSKNNLGLKHEGIKALENYLSFFSAKEASALLFKLKEEK